MGVGLCHTRKLAGLFLLLFLTAGCISTSSEPEIVTTRILPSPEPLNPPAQFNLVEGAATYATSCAPCHGETGLGDGVTAAAFTCPMPKFADRTDNEKMADWFETTHDGNGSQDATCLMPPWNQRLTDEQIWNVVAYAYSLNYGGQTDGAAFIPTLPDEAINTLWQAETSDLDIMNFVQRDLLQRPENEQQAALAYVRSQVYMDAGEVALNTTPEPGETPAPSTTDEPATVTGTFNVGGTLINGTAGAALPQNLTLTLRVVGIGADGNPEELYAAEATTDPAGTFSFNDVPRSDRALASIQTQYAGVRQLAFIDPTTAEETSTITFTVYESTTDPSTVRIAFVENYVDAVTAESASLTLQSYEFVNTGDRVYVGENGRTMKIIMPAGASGIQVIGADRNPQRFQQAQEGDNIVYYDSAPLIPNQPERIAASYNMPYPGSMEIEQPLAYPVDDAYVFLSEPRELAFTSDMMQQGETVFNEQTNINYVGYQLISDTLELGTALRYRVQGGTEIATTTNTPVRDVSTSSDDKSFLQENTPLILGLGVLMVIAGGMFLFYDLQKSRIAAQAQQNSTRRIAHASKEELIAEIAALDTEYEAGRIDETSYQRQRSALKDLLREKLE